jgi:hypothetical protein
VAVVAILAAFTVSDGEASATMVRRGRLARRQEESESPVAVEVA